MRNMQVQILRPEPFKISITRLVILCKFMTTPNRTEKVCKKHGTQEFIQESNGYFRCKRCRNNHVVKYRQDAKLKLLKHHGGKCKSCGYDKCIRNLTFHHYDPSKKERQISGATVSYERLKKESLKCILLCSNCHGEVHDGILIL